MPTRAITVYTDYKSPYAYLAVRPAYALEVEYDVRLNWLPYTLNIPLYLGNVDDRNDHQWRRVRYSYMDARRLANRVGLVVRGPKKIFDSSLAGIGLLFAKREGVFRRYNDIVFARFWKRELDIEDPQALKSRARRGGRRHLFVPRATSKAKGGTSIDHVIAEAHDLGVFGVPMFVLDGELFWGGDRIDLLKERLHQTTTPAVS